MSTSLDTPETRTGSRGLLFVTVMTAVNLIVLAILLNLVITQFAFLPQVGVLVPDGFGTGFLLVAGAQAAANGLFLLSRDSTRRVGAGVLLGCLAALAVAFLLSWLGPSGTGF